MNENRAKELLTQYLLGDLDAATQAGVDAWLGESESCRAEARDIEPILDLLRAALAAPDQTPERLCAERKARIVASAAQDATPSTTKPGILHGITDGWPGLARVAALITICCVLAGLLIPASLSVRRVAREPKAIFGLKQDMTGEDWTDGNGAPPPNADYGTIQTGTAGTRDTWGARRGKDAQPEGTEFDDNGERFHDPGAAPVNSPKPAELDAVRIVKSPIIMKDISLQGQEHWETAREDRRSEHGRVLDIRRTEPRAPVDAEMPRSESDVKTGSDATPPEEMVPLKLKLPKPRFAGTPKKIKSGNLEAYPYAGQARDRDKQSGSGNAAQLGNESAGSYRWNWNRRDHGLSPQPDTGAPDGRGARYGGPAGAGRAVDAPDQPRGEVASTATENTVSFAVEKDPEPEPEDPTRFRAFGVNPFYTVKDQAFSTFSIDVDTAAYTVGRRYMSQGFLPPAESVRTEEYVNFFDYGYKASRHRTFTIHADSAPSRFGRGLHLLKIGVKGRRLGREEQRQAVLTFLIDTSGSMDKPDRLGLVQQSLKLLVSKLNPEDRVAIIQYASHARVVIDHTAVRDRRKILAAIDALQCGGSTNLEEGMRRAYQLAAVAFLARGENRVLLLSDGVANLGTGDAADILKQIERYRKQGITCSVFGFGMGTYDDEMLETLANKGDGNYTFIDSREQAQRVFVDDLAATLNTIAADVKIQVEFDPRRVKRYRQLGYENRQLAKEDFRNDAVDAGEVGSGQSVTALYEVELTDTASRSPLCVVRVRYRRVDTGAVEEIEELLKPTDRVADFNRATARFRLAACVAEFAEILRGSPYAAGSDCADVASVLRPVALELDLDQNVQELLRLVQSAGSMVRGEW